MTEPAALLGRCLFPPAGTRVTCAVSGGADSLALLVLARAAECEVTAVHVDHGVRPGSAGEAAVVESVALRFGARFRAERVTVPKGPNLEARMRAARYAVLPHDVLTGHTADDQAETVLLHLLRGSGTAGLAGIRISGRPILALRRRETEALCHSLDLTPVEDPSNASPEFRRNRVRHELLPLAEAIAERDVIPLLTRTADLAREDNDLLEELSLAIDPTDARVLASAPRPLAARAVRRWLSPLLGGYPPDSDAVDRVLNVANGRATACEITGAITVRRSGQHLSARTSQDTPLG